MSPLSLSLLNVMILLKQFDVTNGLVINNSLAYTWTSGYPQSCECVETGVTSKDCNLFKCTCACDLVAGSCDYNCCCDPDCSTAQVDRFKALNACDQEGFTPDIEKFCYSSDELQKVNPRSPVGGKPTSTDALDEMLCVEKMNKESKGEFYQDTNIRSSSVFGQSEGQKDYSYVPETLTEAVTDTFYDENDTIAAFTNTASGIVKINAPGYLPIPRSDFSGYCNDNNFAQFRIDSSATCIRRFSKNEAEFEAQCTQGFASTELMVTKLLLSSVPSSGTQSSAYVSPTLVSVKTVAGGAEADVTNRWEESSCDTGIENNVTAYNASCQFGLARASDEMICRNAIVGLEYTVHHSQDAQSTVVNVTVALVIGDVAFNGANLVSVAQTFGIAFIDTADSLAVTQRNGNQVSRYKSGNPGYLMGYPILFGSLNSTSQTILVANDGLSVLSAVIPLSTCPSESTPSSSQYSVGVRFGYDSSVGCALSLNRSAMRSFCCDGAELCESGFSSEFSYSSGVPVFLFPQKGYVGVFGNADPLDATQWFQISQQSPAPLVSNRRWTEASSTCTSMITGVHYKFLVVYTGEKKNPQNKIVSAAVEYSTSNINMRVPYGDETSEEAITLSTTVTFIFQESQNLKRYTPPPPPGLLTVPYDIFYPFNIGNAAHRDGTLQWVNILLSLGVAVFGIAALPYMD